MLPSLGELGSLVLIIRGACLAPDFGGTYKIRCFSTDIGVITDLTRRPPPL